MKGFKGFNKDLKCKDEQFYIGGIKAKDSDPLKKPNLCSSDGYHYCEKFEDVLSYYPDTNGNRYCEIEILGSHATQGDKSITTSLRVVRELSRKEILELKTKPPVKLEVVRELQTKYPHFIVGGSMALYLHGVRLSRWNNGGSDLDVITPYYTLIEGALEIDDMKSGCDFDYQVKLDNLKVDCLIDPKARYEIVKHKEVSYKVIPMLQIVRAKVDYALKGNEKHKSDLKDMIIPN
jgi:hypothetical protein